MKRHEEAYKAQIKHPQEKEKSFKNFFLIC